MPRKQNAAAIYDTVQLFREKCLMDDQSLLWSEPRIWTVKNLQQLKKALIDNPDFSDKTFWEKLRDQLQEVPDDCVRILSDVVLIYGLPSTFMLAETKWENVEKVASMAGIKVPDPHELIMEALNQGFTRTSQRYHQKYRQLWFVLLAALDVKQCSDREGILHDPWRCARLFDDVLADVHPPDRGHDMRHGLLHMMFPETFESIISTNHKRQIVSAFVGEESSLSHSRVKKDPGLLTSLDETLAEVRANLRQRDLGETSFYDNELAYKWKSDRSPVNGEDEEDDVELTDPQLEDLIGPLKTNGQLILYGPPGTGKTYYAKRLAEALVATQNFEKDVANLSEEESRLLRLDETVQTETPAWWCVANPERWSWGDCAEGTTVNVEYGRVKQNFEEAQSGDLVFGYDGSPTKTISAIGVIEEPVFHSPSGKVMTIRCVESLNNPVEHNEVRREPSLQFLESIRFSNRGTLFRVSSQEAEHLLKIIRKLDPDAGLPETRVDDHVIPYLRMCTFHPAYGYEEFVEGFRPGQSGDGSTHFEIEDGIFKKLCIDAIQQPDKAFVLIIDEINRGNIPRIFGELITLLEMDKRWHRGRSMEFGVILPTSKQPFAVPKNVFIIGTMNTADKSIALLDTALRRRFAFRELMPEISLLSGSAIAGIPLDKLLSTINERVTRSFGRNLQVGHSYFLVDGKPLDSWHGLVSVLRDKIFPLLQDYCYDDYEALASILGERIVDPENERFRPEVVGPGKDERLLAALRELVGRGE